MHDTASSDLTKAEVIHTLAVTNHCKLHGKLNQKAVTVELICQAWQMVKEEAGVTDAPGSENKSKMTESNVVSP